MKIKENWATPFYLSMGWYMSMAITKFQTLSNRQQWKNRGVIWRGRGSLANVEEICPVIRAITQWQWISSYFPTGNVNTVYAQKTATKREQNFKSLLIDQRKDSWKDIKQILSIWGVHLKYIFILDNYIWLCEYLILCAT